MGLKKQILKALKTIGETEYKSKLVSEPVFIKDTETFDDLLNFIDELMHQYKHLKKENNKLKCKNNFLFQNGERLARSVIRLFGENLELSNGNDVAEFKCAKTNKPTKNKWYWCVVSDGDELTFKWIKYLEGAFDDDVGETTLAFTETSPEDILKNLKS